MRRSVRHTNYFRMFLMLIVCALLASVGTRFWSSHAEPDLKPATSKPSIEWLTGPIAAKGLDASVSENLMLTPNPLLPQANVNFALASNGGVASASSTFSAAYPVAATNNGDRKGLNWGNGGGWADANNGVFPDWLQINFSGSKTINEIDVFTVQDDRYNPVEPTESMVFTYFGITAFQVQYWNGASWLDVPGGNVTGNNRVWRKFSFPAVTTTSIRVVVNGSPDGWSRIVEVEAYQSSVPQSPFYEGWHDGADCTRIFGWAADRNQLNTSISVDIYDGATLLSTVLANQLRSDVGAYLGDNGLHGFNFPVPASLLNGQPHSITVKFAGTNTNLSGTPKSITCSACTMPTAPPPSSFPPDNVWVEDQTPSGAVLGGTWVWDTTQKASGWQSNTEPATTAVHQHYFYGASQRLAISPGDKLVSYVLLNPCAPPQEIMLQWNDSGGSWEHRAIWGADLIGWGAAGTASRYAAGALPQTGVWVRLEVPASAVGLEGNSINGMAFTLYDGQAWFDRAGKLARLAPISVTASGNYTGSLPSLAVDRNLNTAWNSGGYAPQWIQLDLGQPATVSQIRLSVNQLPNGQTTHEIYGGADPQTLTLIRTVSGFTQAGQWLDITFSPAVNNIRYLKILTTASPSWVSWYEIEVYGSFGSTDLVGYWKFDEGMGLVAADSSGNNNNATLQNGTAWTTGQSNSGVSFDGVDDYVQVGTGSTLRMTSALTIAAWVNPTGDGIIVNKEGEYEVAVLGGHIQWAIANTNPGWAWIDTGYTPPLNQWTHIAVTYDNGTIQTYANGVLVHTYAGAGAIGDVDPASNDLRIGGRQCCPEPFHGKLDEVQVYNRALSATEIQNLAQGVFLDVTPLPPDGAGELSPISEIVQPRPSDPGITPQSYFGAASDCMEGDVLLRAVFVDSDGTYDPNTFSWTDAEVDTFASKVANEIEWTWSLFAPRYGERVKVFVEKFRVPVPYEPVNHSGAKEETQLWLNPALSRLLNQSWVGTTWEDAFNSAAEFGRLGRDGNNQFGRTFNYATTIFFAPNGKGKTFTNGYTAFAYLGGPFAIVLRENYSVGTEERVAAHEFGHLFYAEDEYPGATRCNSSTDCNAVTPQDGRSTCYNTLSKNGNCAVCNTASVSCMMQYNAHAICTYTPRSIGWLGPRLQEPVITRIKCPSCTTGGKIVIKGTGLDATTQVYINRVLYTQARYRPDYGDIVVPNLRFGTGHFEVIVFRGSDSLYSDAFDKIVSAATSSTETGF